MPYNRSRRPQYRRRRTYRRYGRRNNMKKQIKSMINRTVETKWVDYTEDFGPNALTQYQVTCNGAMLPLTYNLMSRGLERYNFIGNTYRLKYHQIRMRYDFGELPLTADGARPTTLRIILFQWHDQDNQPLLYDILEGSTTGNPWNITLFYNKVKGHKFTILRDKHYRIRSTQGQADSSAISLDWKISYGKEAKYKKKFGFSRNVAPTEPVYGNNHIYMLVMTDSASLYTTGNFTARLSFQDA